MRLAHVGIVGIAGADTQNERGHCNDFELCMNR